MTALPRVLAMTPAYNGEAFLQRTLESLAAQTYPALRVLIADDASTDATADIAEAHVRRDSRFSLVRRSTNLGWTGNTNAMLKDARGQAEYMLFAFHDDVLFPDYVARLAARLDSQPDAVLAFSDAELRFEDQAPQTAAFTRLEQVTSARARTAIMARMPENWWIPAHGMFRASAAETIGSLKRSRRGEVMADWPWLVRLASIGAFVREPDILTRKYFRKSSVSGIWRHDADAYRAVAATVAKEIRASDLPPQDKAVALACLARFYAYWLVHKGPGDDQG
jgi:glycosyltransferase involved in cell wall biosynthesis